MPPSPRPSRPLCVPAQPARTAARPADRDRAPARPRPRWPRRSRIIGRASCPAWWSRATAMPCRASASPLPNRPIRCPMPPGSMRPDAMLALVQGLSADDLVLCLMSRRRLGPAVAAGRGVDSRGQAGGQPRAARLRREYQRDELRPPASVGNQGRAARGGVPSGQGADVAHFGRAGRQPDRYRLRPDRARSDDMRGCAGNHPALRHLGIAGRARNPRKRPRRVGEAGQSASRRHRDPYHRGPAKGARSGCRRGRGGRDCSAYPRRRDRRRGARRRQGDGRSGAPGRPAQPAFQAVLRPCCPAARPR